MRQGKLLSLKPRHNHPKISRRTNRKFGLSQSDLEAWTNTPQRRALSSRCSFRLSILLPILSNNQCSKYKPLSSSQSRVVHMLKPITGLNNHSRRPCCQLRATRCSNNQCQHRITSSDSSERTSHRAMLALHSIGKNRWQISSTPSGALTTRSTSEGKASVARSFRRIINQPGSFSSQPVRQDRHMCSNLSWNTQSKVLNTRGLKF